MVRCLCAVLKGNEAGLVSFNTDYGNEAGLEVIYYRST